MTRDFGWAYWTILALIVLFAVLAFTLAG